MSQTKDLNFPTVRYINEHLGAAALLPKDDYDEDGHLALESRELHRLFMREERDTIAAGYRERVLELAKKHEADANACKSVGDDVGFAKNTMRQLYALHCAHKMNI